MFRRLRKRIKAHLDHEDLDVSVAIIVCVHNALDDTRECLESLLASINLACKIIVVDDGSDEPTRRFLETFVRVAPKATLLRHDAPLGYTCAANAGLRASGADISVLLNSDTVLPFGSIERLIAGAKRRKKTGLAGPLSNAASYQSIPRLSGEDGKWTTNPLPEGASVNDMARALKDCTGRKHPRVPLLNGFCLAIKREVIERIGYFDEEAFPHGYGEENDFCLRAADAGFHLVVCDDVYVFHKKSRSYGKDRRADLVEAGGAKLIEKHGKKRIKRAIKTMVSHPGLAHIRSAFAARLESLERDDTTPANKAEFRLLFLLPVRGYSGGAHSVIQEARGLRELGVFVQVAIPLRYRPYYESNYPDYPDELFYYYRRGEVLKNYAGNFNICVATIFVTVKTLSSICKRHPEVLPAYYIQDHEPRFEPEGSDLHREAVASYTLVPDILAFAKTDWLRETVTKNHGIEVAKVEASIDHDVYFPGPKTGGTGAPVRIAAMVRPKTPRRNPGLTMKILKRITQAQGVGVDAHVFGLEESDPKVRKLETDFPFHSHGLCTQREVADILRGADIFVDFSAYQAFGRTALEAMACRCAVILPKKGGAIEYAREEVNCLLVDTSSETEMFNALQRLVEQTDFRARLSEEAVRTASFYTVEKASHSELLLFRKHLKQRVGRGVS